METILQKVRDLVPFVRDWSKVEWGGDHAPIKESYIKTHRWQNGWREEGQLLLNADGDPVGKVFHNESNGQGEQWEGKPDVYPGGEVFYLLSYDVKNDTEEEEWANLCRIEEGKKMTIQYWQLTSGDIFAIKMVNGEFSEACGPLHHKDVTLKNLEEENFEFETEDISWLNEQDDKGNLKLKKIEEE